MTEYLRAHGSGSGWSEQHQLMIKAKMEKWRSVVDDYDDGGGREAAVEEKK